MRLLSTVASCLGQNGHGGPKMATARVGIGVPVAAPFEGEEKPLVMAKSLIVNSKRK